MIDLYTAATPNGYKVTIMLEECGLPYRPHFLSLPDGEQKAAEFVAINPNGRIPAIVDDDGERGPFAVFESGAILLYLAERSGHFLSIDPEERSVAVQWLMWQMGGLGPMMGQLNVFRRYFPEQLPSVIERYERESYRLLGVLDARLADHAYLAGRDYGVADIACWPWIASADWSGLDLARFQGLRRWFDQVGERPAVQRGMTIPPRAERSPEKDQAVADRARKMLS